MRLARTKNKCKKGKIGAQSVRNPYELAGHIKNKKFRRSVGDTFIIFYAAQKFVAFLSLRFQLVCFHCFPAGCRLNN